MVNVIFDILLNYIFNEAKIQWKMVEYNSTKVKVRAIVVIGNPAE